MAQILISERLQIGDGEWLKEAEKRKTILMENNRYDQKDAEHRY